MVRTEIPSSSAIGPVWSQVVSDIVVGLIDRPSPDQFQNTLEMRVVPAGDLEKILISIRKLLEMVLQDLHIQVEIFALLGMNMPAFDLASQFSFTGETVLLLGHCQGGE